MLPLHSVKITPAGLFLKRAVSNLRYQYGIIRTAVDWTVALYIVLPALVFFIYQYISWWDKVPDWFVFMEALIRGTGQGILQGRDYALILPALYLSAFSASIRYFVDAADQLFVIRSIWYRAQLRLGLLYSLAVSGWMVMLWFALWAPLIMRTYSSITIAGYIWIAAVTILFKMVLGLLHQWIRLRYFSWRRLLLRMMLFTIGGLSYFAAVTFGLGNFYRGTALVLGMIVLLYAAGSKRAAMKGTFLQEAAEERRERLLLAAFMLRGIVEPSKTAASSATRKRPWIFRRSQRLFRRRTPVNGVTEFVLKACVRSKVQRRLYLQFIAIMAAALVLSPIWLKYMLWLVSSLLLALWMKKIVKELLEEQLLKLLGLQDEDRFGTLKKATYLLVTPGMLVLSLLQGLLVLWGSAWYLIVLGTLFWLLSGYAIGRVSAETVTTFSS
jgi:ABC-2 type transport system permease protein